MDNIISRRSLIVAVGSAIVTGVAASQTDGDDITTSSGTAFLNKINTIESLDYKSIASLSNQVYEWNDQVATTLLTKLNSGASSADTRIYAIYLLGILKIASASEALVSHVALKDTNRSQQLNSALPLWGEYPAQGALVSIGNPSLPAIIQGIASTDDEQQGLLLVQVIREVCYYHESAEGYIQGAIATQQDDVKKLRLRSALETLDKIR